MINMDEFMKDYNQLNIRDLLRKYDLSTNRYAKLKKEYNLPAKTPVFKPSIINPRGIYSKNYTKVKESGHFQIKRRKDGKTTSYITVPTEHIAKLIVAKLREYDWDKSKLDLIKREIDFDWLVFEHKYSHVCFKDFVKDNDRMSISEILEKYRINIYEYRQIRETLGVKKKRYMKRNICNEWRDDDEADQDKDR